MMSSLLSVLHLGQIPYQDHPVFAGASRIGRVQLKYASYVMRVGLVGLGGRLDQRQVPCTLKYWPEQPTPTGKALRPSFLGTDS